MIGKESPFGEKTAWLTGFDRSNFGKIVQKNLEGSNTNYIRSFIGYRLFYRSDNAASAIRYTSSTFSTSPMDKDLDYHKVTDEVSTLDMYTITETIKAIAVGTSSLISGEDTPTRISIDD